nr:hypothetical protein [Gemmatimonadales bacterium]
CGHPDYRAVRAPALVIGAVISSPREVFPLWRSFDPAQREAARDFTSRLQRWAATERARVRRELAGAQMLLLHGANHYVFDSNEAEVERAMRRFLAEERR